MRLNLPILFTASMALLAAACSTPVPRGHVRDEDIVKTIKPGVTTKEVVQQELGSPSTESSFGLVTWYYVSGTRNVRSLLAPQITEQNVVEIAFDGGGVVSSVKEYTLADGKQVAMANRITPSEGQQLGFFEQIFGNLGRFNKDGASASPSGRHGSAGVPGPGR